MPLIAGSGNHQKKALLIGKLRRSSLYQSANQEDMKAKQRSNEAVISFPLQPGKRPDKSPGQGASQRDSLTATMAW